MNYSFSALAQASLTPSAINELTAGFAEDFREGVDINLGVGYVNDRTIPFEAIQKAYAEIVARPERYRNALNYGGAEGSPNLRRSIREYYLKNGIGQLNAQHFQGRRILIGANGATSLLDALSDVLQPGVVITADPYYYIYTETLERKGFRILAIPEDEQGLDVDLLEEAVQTLDPRTISFFYLVTVNNPSTVILSDARRKSLVALAESLSCQTGVKIPVVFDKAYEDIIHNPELAQPVSGLRYDTLGLVLEVGTLSKILAPALRIGYALVPDDQLADALVQRTSDIGFSSSLINQEIAGWLLDHHILVQKEKVNRGYRDKALYIQNLFRRYLSNYLESYTGGEAGFYFYLTLNQVRTDKGSPFFQFLTRTTGDPSADGCPEKKPRLVYIPGSICSRSPKSLHQLRLSYGFEEDEVFERAVQLIAEACEYDRVASLSSK